MKKVVLLAPYFLPRRRVGAWRPYKFAIHLREFGWDPHVITIHEPNESLTEHESELLSDIPVFKLKSPIDLTRAIGHQLQYDDEIKEAQSRSNGNDHLFNRILTWIDKQIPIDPWLLLLMWRKKEVEPYIKKVDPKILWSTGDPWSSHWLAARLVEKYHFPWVADFRDPWAIGKFQKKNTPRFTRWINRRLEKKCVQQASLLTFTSQKTEKLYKDHYGLQISASKTIPNSYDSTLFNGCPPNTQHFDAQYLNLVFFGRFRPLAPAEGLIELLHDVRKKSPAMVEKIRIYSFGTLTEEERQHARRKNVYKNFIIEEPIALENALTILSQADVLWLSTHKDMRNIIPAKFWDYLAARRPIISTVPNREVADILQKTGAGVQFDAQEQRDELVNLLIQSAEAKMLNKTMPIFTAFDEQQIKQYDASATTKTLACIFDRLT